MKKTLLSLLFSCGLLSASVQPPKTFAQSSLVEVGHTHLFCQTMGKGSPLIVVHGGPGLSHDHLVPYLSKLAEDHFVIFYDQRGGGRSDTETDQAYLETGVFVEDLDAIRKAYGLEKVSILGHSWGSYIAMQYAIAHPENTDRLVLMHSLPVTSDETGRYMQIWMTRMSPYMKELEQISASKEFLDGDPDATDNYLHLIFRTYCAVSEKADLLNVKMTPQANKNMAQVSAVFEKNLIMQPYDIRADLQKIHCPTLIIHGDQDPIPPSSASTIHENIADSKLVILEDCGHFSFLEKPEKTHKLITSFLN